MPASAVVARGVNQVWPVGAAGGGVRRVGGRRDIERQPSLKSNDAVGLPLSEGAPQQPIRGGEEGNVVNEGGEKTVTDVPVGVAIIGLPPIGNHGSAAAIGVGTDVQRMRPGI